MKAKRPAARDPLLGLRVLWIDRCPDDHRGSADCLQEQGCQVDIVPGASGRLLARRGRHDVVLIDLTASAASGLALLRQIRATTSAPVIALASPGSLVDTAVEAMKLGASDFRTRPDGTSDLGAILRSALAANGSSARTFVSRRPSAGQTALGAALQCVDRVRPDQDARESLTAEYCELLHSPALALSEFVAIAQSLALIQRAASVSAPVLFAVHQRLGAAIDRAAKPVDPRASTIVAELEAAGPHWRRVTENAVAERIGVGRSSVWRLLNGAYGVSFPTCRRAVGMRMAVAELAGGEWQVAQIAYRIGYEHPSNFNRDFCGFLRLSPRRYRNCLALNSTRSVSLATR